MRIAIVDGQGGGMGKTLIEKLRNALGGQVQITALGTNALATMAMMKAGADEGATGENAIVYNVSRVDVIMGVIGIITANSMLGELTPAMARAVSESPALKVLIPLNRCNIFIAGIRNETLPALMDAAVERVRELL